MIICLCGDKFFIKVQPVTSYGLNYYDILFIIGIFAIPINSIHKCEIDKLAPIRLDQELDTGI